MAGLPAVLKNSYQKFGLPVVTSPWANWAGSKKPWKVCYSSPFSGSPWIDSFAGELKRLAESYKQAGLVSGFTQEISNSNVPLQNQQIREFTTQGCSIIYLFAGSTTGLNSAIEAAYNKHIPVVTMAGSVTSTYAINVDSNGYLEGETLANEIIQSGAKNVIMVQGLATSSISNLENQGAIATFKNSHVNVVARVYGNWTPSVTKQVLLTTLSTHTGPVDAVWSTGSEAAEIAAAFTQSGRKLPLITASVSGDGVGYWHANQSTFKFTGVGFVPSWTADIGWRVGMRTLAGQGPKINEILVPVPPVTQAMLPQLYESCMTPSSSSVFPVLPNDPLPTDQMNTYFGHGSGEVGPYSYSQIPKACA